MHKQSTEPLRSTRLFAVPRSFPRETFTVYGMSLIRMKHVSRMDWYFKIVPCFSYASVTTLLRARRTEHYLYEFTRARFTTHFTNVTTFSTCHEQICCNAVLTAFHDFQEFHETTDSREGTEGTFHDRASPLAARLRDQDPARIMELGVRNLRVTGGRI